MTLPFLYKSITLLELLISWLAVYAFLRSRECRTRFSAVGAYLVTYAGAGTVLLSLTNFRLGISAAARIETYFYVYSTAYICMAVVMFFVVQQLLVEVLAALPALCRWALIGFRWIALASSLIIVSFTLRPTGLHGAKFQLALTQLTRGISLLELLMLAFVLLIVYTLKLPFRSRAFGLGLGFAVISATVLMQTLLPLQGAPLIGMAAMAGELVQVGVLVLWCVYLFRKEPAAIPRRVVEGWQLARLDEIADAIGPAPEQQVQQLPSSFFLRDVENLVDRVLDKNALKTPPAP